MTAILPLVFAAASLTVSAGTSAAHRESPNQKVALEGIICQYTPPWKNSLGPLSYILTSEGAYLLKGSDIPTDAAWKTAHIEAGKTGRSSLLTNIRIVKSTGTSPEQTTVRLTGTIRISTPDAPMKGDPYFLLSVPVPGQNERMVQIDIPMKISQTGPAIDLQKYGNRPVRIEATVRLYHPAPVAPDRMLQRRGFESQSHPSLTITGIALLEDADTRKESFRTE